MILYAPSLSFLGLLTLIVGAVALATSFGTRSIVPHPAFCFPSVADSSAGQAIRSQRCHRNATRLRHQGRDHNARASSRCRQQGSLSEAGRPFTDHGELDDDSGVAMSTIASDTAVYNRRFLRLVASREWIKRVQVILESEPCDACRIQPRAFEVGEYPPLPVVRCTKSRGCACWYAVTPAG